MLINVAIFRLSLSLRWVVILLGESWQHLFGLALWLVDGDIKILQLLLVVLVVALVDLVQLGPKGAQFLDRATLTVDQVGRARDHTSV